MSNKSGKSKAAGVPFARGFRRPGPAVVKRALGKVKDSECFLYEDSLAEPLFGPLPQPTCEDDWLAQYKEDGQTYAEFLDISPWLSRRRRKYMKQRFEMSGTNITEKYPDGKIYLLPLGSFGDGSHSCRFDDLAEYTRIFFGSIPVVQLPGVDLDVQQNGVYWRGSVTTGVGDNSGHDEAVPPPAKRRRAGDEGQKKPPRHYLPSRHHTEPDGRSHFQLQVSGVLAQLRQSIPDDALCLIALTMADLYDTKPDLFVAGFADGRNRVATFSFFRYHPAMQFSSEFWYDVRHEGSLAADYQQRLLLLRSCRLLVHETCHLLGIDHCIFYACCMNGSGHLQEDFSQPMHLCPVDLHKLQTLCGFDIVDRYRKLAAFFQQHQFQEECEWATKRLTAIESQGST